MPITFPCYGRGSDGPGCCSRRDGRCGHGGQGGPLCCHKRNPMLAFNLGNSTLTTSISPSLALRFHVPSATAPPPPSCCHQAPVYYWCCAGAGLWQSLQGQPLIKADHGESGPREEGEAWGRDDRGEGLADRGLPIRCASAAGGEGPYSPTTASFAVCDRHVPRLAGTPPCH